MMIIIIIIIIIIMFVSVTNNKHDQVMKRKTRYRQQKIGTVRVLFQLACRQFSSLLHGFSLDEQKTIGVMMHFFNSPSCSDKLKKKNDLGRRSLSELCLFSILFSEIAVASVNISKIRELRFPDILGDDFSNNSIRSDKVILPRGAFYPNSTGTVTFGLVGDNLSHQEWTRNVYVYRRTSWDPWPRAGEKLSKNLVVGTKAKPHSLQMKPNFRK